MNDIVLNERVEQVYEFYRDPNGEYLATDFGPQATFGPYGARLKAEFVMHHATLTATSGCRHVRRENMSVVNGWLRVPAAMAEALWEQLKPLPTWGTEEHPEWRNQPAYRGVLFCADCIASRYRGVL